jgi:hypothetical protein
MKRMKNGLLSRLSSKRRLAVVGASLVLGASSLAAVALADQLSIDGDVGTAAGDNPLSVTAAPGATVSTTAGLKINWNGSRHVVAGSTVHFSVDAAQTTLPAGYSVGSASVAIPTGTGWDGNSDSTGTGNSTISFTAPNTPGPYSYAVKWSSDESCTSTPCLNNPALQINLTVTSPPANQAPTVKTAALDTKVDEGQTLSASGAFQDLDNDPLTLTADNGTIGTFTGNSNGNWSWSLPTTDNIVPGTITVTANDGHSHTVTDDFTYEAVNVPPTIGNLAFTGTNCDPTLGFTVNDVGTDDTETGTIDWGDSTSDSFGVPNPINAGSSVSQPHQYGSAGSKTVTVNAQDDDLGSATAVTTSYTVNNIPSDILQPINYTGSRSAFKGGSTIPVKIQVADCNGNSVGTLSPNVAVYKVNVPPDPDGTTSEAVSTVPPTSGTTMRYDATGAQYIYNLATRGLTVPSDYKIVVSDPSFASDLIAYVSVKK